MIAMTGIIGLRLADTGNIYICYTVCALCGVFLGSTLVAAPYTGTDNQLWYVGGEYIVKEKEPTKVLDIADGNATNGANIIVYGKHGGNNQKWTFEYSY